MAEEEQTQKSEGPNLFNEAVLFVGALFIGVIVLGGIASRFGAWFGEDGSVENSVFLDTVGGYLLIILPFLQIISIIVSAVMVMAIIYVVRRRNEIIEDMEREVYPDGYRKPVPSFFNSVSLSSEETTEEEKIEENIREEIILENPRWQHVESSLESENPNDWRQAIIEADILLAELLDSIGYKGVTIGDKLQEVERSDFQTLDKAWEAHKFRNRIAHEGSDLLLSKREARRIVGLYRDVFTEFRYI